MIKFYWNSVRVGILSSGGIMLDKSHKNLVFPRGRGRKFRLWGISTKSVFIGVFRSEEWKDNG